MNKYKHMKQEPLNYHTRYIKVMMSDLNYDFFKGPISYNYMFSMNDSHDIPVFTLNKCYGKTLK